MGCSILFEKMKNKFSNNTFHINDISNYNIQKGFSFLSVSSFNIAINGLKNAHYNYQKINETNKQLVENDLLKKSSVDKFNKLFGINSFSFSETNSLQTSSQKDLSKNKKKSISYFIEIEKFDSIKEETEADKDTGKKLDTAKNKINFDTISQFKPNIKMVPEEFGNEKDINYVVTEFINSIFTEVQSEISMLKEKLDES